MPSAGQDPSVDPASALFNEPPRPALRTKVFGPWVALLVLILLSLLAFARMELQTDITFFLPDSHSGEGRFVESMSRSPMSRRVVIAVQPGNGGWQGQLAADRADVSEPIAQLTEHLRRSGAFRDVRHGPSPGDDAAVYNLFFGARTSLAAPACELQDVDRCAAVAARHLRDELASPVGLMTRRIAPADPWLLFSQVMDRTQRVHHGGSVRIEQQHFVASDRNGSSWYLIFAEPLGSPFDSSVATRVDGAVERALGPLVRGGWTARWSGVHRHTAFSAARVQSDLGHLSVWSSLSLLFFFLLFVRGWRWFVLGGLALWAGVVGGTLACRAIFPSMHAITFAFGASLLGVGIDFVLHYFNDRVWQTLPDSSSYKASPNISQSSASVWPGLVLGALTTILGLFALVFAGIPALREMAVFSSAAVLSSLLAVRLWVMPWSKALSPTRPHQALATLGSHFLKVTSSRYATWSASILALFSAGILCQAEWNDDSRALSPSDELLADTDRFVRELLGADERRLALFVQASSLERALEINDRVALAVSSATLPAQARQTLQTLSDFVPALAAQRNRHAFWTSQTTQRATLAALELEGFDTTAFGPFVADTVFTPISLESVIAAGLGSLVEPFVLQRARHDIRLVSWIDLNGVDAQTQRSLCRQVEQSGALCVSPREAARSIFFEFRRRFLLLVLCGFLMVVVSCSIKYRSVRLGLSCALPAALAAALALSLVSLVHQLNLMHLVAALLVLSMGEDYAIFFVEAHLSEADDRTSGHRARVWSGVALCALTTVATFGVLATSGQVALQSLGQVTSLGVLFAMLLAPLGARFLLPKKSPD